MESTFVKRKIGERTHLKRMLVMAKALPEGAPGREATIARLEMEILYIKLYLNALY